MSYAYSDNEKILMALFSAFSNFSVIPTLLLLRYTKRYFEFYFGILTFVSSFLYHFTESLEIKIILKPGRWHKLDNIGSIVVMNSLFINNLNNVTAENKIELNFISFLLVLVFQFDHFWKLENTIFPVLIFAVIMICNFIYCGFPKFKKNMLKKSMVIFIIALFMFAFGLDENNDYLRIYHSLWHFLGGISIFYILQMQEKENFSYFDFLSINFLKKKFLKNEFN